MCVCRKTALKYQQSLFSSNLFSSSNIGFYSANNFSVFVVCVCARMLRLVNPVGNDCLRYGNNANLSSVILVCC